MVKYVMRKQQRGPTSKLSFSVIRQGSDFTEIATEPVDMENMAIVILIFKGIENSTNLQIRIKMIKNEKVKNKVVPMTIAFGKIEEQHVCSNKWMETGNKVTSSNSMLSYTAINRMGNLANETTLLYSFEVDITIQAIGGTDSTSIPDHVMNHLYENTEFTDFQMKARDGFVPVHRAVVVAHSDMFKTMLQREDWTETKEGSINIKDVTVKTLQHLKAYMYLGILPNEDLESLLLIASYYLMDKLRAECIEKLVKSVEPEDLEDLVEFACQNNMPDLMKAILFQTPDRTLTSAYLLDIENQMQKNN